MTRVIKVGGRPQLDPALPGALAAAHRANYSALPGAKATSTEAILVVHGGGDEVSTLQGLYGVQSEFRGGRRVTREADLEIIRMALSGSANKRLVSALVSQEVPAIGLSGEDGGILVAELADMERFGYVGTASQVNASLLDSLLAQGFMLVISPVSRCVDTSISQCLNVNGDDAAAAIAVALKATELLFVSDVPGMLVDGVAVSMLEPADAQRYIEDGTAQGGMAAKLEAALAALQGGVERVRISDIAAIEQLDRGTVLTRVGSVHA
ncbi:acetylglutamate kinase [soil metagenome]